MIVDLQLLCTHRRGQAGSGGGSPESAADGTTRGPPSPSPALAHVYGIEDPFCELLQLVGGVLGLFLQPQVVLPQVLNFCLKVGFVFFFLGGRGEKDSEGWPQLAGLLGRVATDLSGPFGHFCSSIH